MQMSLNPNHRARYDENGNIILPLETKGAGETEETEEQRSAPSVLPTAYCPLPTPKGEVLWEEIEEETPLLKVPTHPPLIVWRELRGKLYETTRGMLSEGRRQYHWSFLDGKTLLQNLRASANRGTKRTWSFLTQPVWVPTWGNKPKQYSRGTLFVLDVVRFGGTFAFLFTTLFVSLNYQSFWQIVKARVDPLTNERMSKELAGEVQDPLTEKLKRVPSLSVAGRADGDLLSLLPTIGPPIPTLIVPKLGLNVPIKLPPPDALIREDWTKLEEDIQTALQDGVVHYPGTARPGQAGNFFITGHSSFYPWAKGDYKSVFARLAELDVGDEYWVFYGGDKFRYVVKEKKEVKPSDVTVLDQPMNRRYGTLMTCTPVGTTLRRLILQAQEIDPITGAPLHVGEHGKQQQAPKVRVEMLPI